MLDPKYRCDGQSHGIRIPIQLPLDYQGWALSVWGR